MVLLSPLGLRKRLVSKYKEVGAAVLSSFQFSTHFIVRDWNLSSASNLLCDLK